MYADELLLPWFGGLMERLPGVRLVDAHTHLGGNDPDGWRCTPAELIGALDLAGARAVVFPLMERVSYQEANDAVLAAAAASQGRLVPFCRVNPHNDPARELQRCLAAGARGVKLHPRAERFDLRHPGVASVFAAAAEHRLPVIIHAGLGIPSLGCDALRLAERYPGAPLILAHLGVTDLAWIWRHLGDHPSLFFDTAWWNPADHLALFAHVPPGRILLGSDAPFGTPAAAAIVAIRCALQAGLTPAQIQAVTGGQLQRLLAGDDPADLGPAPGRHRPARLCSTGSSPCSSARWPECSTASRPRVSCSSPAWAARPARKHRRCRCSARSPSCWTATSGTRRPRSWTAGAPPGST